MDYYWGEVAAVEGISGWSADYAAICEIYDNDPEMVAQWLKDNPEPQPQREWDIETQEIQFRAEDKWGEV